MASTIQRITPFLWFEDRAEEAAKFYTSVFKNSEIVSTTRYTQEAAKASGRPPGSAMTVVFRLDGLEFVALNGGPGFKFTEAVSFVVNCGSQQEIDYYWNRLSAGGDERAQQCGWLKDRFGLSWQIVPANMERLLSSSDPERARKIMAAILQMKKIDMETLARV